MTSHRLILVLGAGLLLGGCSDKGPINPDQSDAAVVQADVRKLMDAVYSSDIDTVIGFTHPNIIEAMGGPGQARAALSQGFSQIASAGLNVESLGFPAAPTFLETDAHRFAIVPTLTTISANGMRVESANFQLGVLDRGDIGWKYIEGSRINKLNVRTLFPDFPADFEFPETSRKKL